MLHATGLLLVLGLASPASPSLSVRAESRFVAVQHASALVAGAPANAGPRAAAVDWADAARSGTPDAWAHAVRLGDGGVARAALSVLAAPVQLDVGPNRVRVLVRVALP